MNRHLNRSTLIIIAGMLFSLALMRPALAEHRETNVVLNNNPNAHVPVWNQPVVNEFSMGCGPTAWAIVYGYWKHYKHKANLFDGNTIDPSSNGNSGGGGTSPTVISATSEIAKLVRTYYHEKFDKSEEVPDVKRVGSTNHHNMCDGIQYAKAHGYPHSRCWRIVGSEFNKFEHVKRYLEFDRPVILRYSTKGHTATNHYGVIEGARKIEERVGDSWRDRDVMYYINDGHGNREWISARQVGLNTGKINTVKDLFLITVSENPLVEAADPNEEACKEWCAGEENCKMCSHLAGCGPGYEQIKAFKEADKNWYACRQRDTARSGHSEENRLACEGWCENNAECNKCSTEFGCGSGYHRLRSWTGLGNNWHACARDEESNFDRESDANFRACKEWCDATPECVHCTTVRGCGPDMTNLRSWTGRGRNWHACKVSSRQEASQSNEEECKNWCNSNPDCAHCSTIRNCGFGFERLRSWTGEGTNWHACREK